MSAYENVKFSQLGYTFIFDDDFRCLYSDSNSMAERLKGCRSIRNAMIVNRGRCQPFEHRFSFGKVRYRAAFIPFFEFCYICRVYPEDCYMRCAYSELYKSIFDIRNAIKNTVRAATGIRTVRNLFMPLTNSEISISASTYPRTRSRSRMRAAAP